jgi:Caspase domain
LTRVYQRLTSATGQGCTRVLIIGVGFYPYSRHAKIPVEDLTSVGPSVREFISKLIREWGKDFAAPLYSVDFLLSDPPYPKGFAWSSLGVEGEVSAGTKVDAPTLENVEKAVDAIMKEADARDHFFFLCCGHGFWCQHQGHFILSDYNVSPRNALKNVINLGDFALGLQQEKPRHQWLFFDCCNTITPDVLDSLGNVGNPPIMPTGTKLAEATQNYGKLNRCGFASSAIGMQAFGIKNKGSRFCEMLTDALEGAGATYRDEGLWWIDNTGISLALDTYSDRKPDLPDPDFYDIPIERLSIGMGRMRLRRLEREPLSHLVVLSKPPFALKQAAITITCKGTARQWVQEPPAKRAKLHLDLPAWRFYTVAATYGGIPVEKEIFAGLPLAEAARFSWLTRS